MYSKQTDIDKTTEVVDFLLNKKFIHLGIEFELYPDTNPKTQGLALKRNDTSPHKRISALWQDRYNPLKYRGDVVNVSKTDKRRFTIEISPDKTQIALTGFTNALELIGVFRPIEQNTLFTGHLDTSQGIIQGIPDHLDIGMYIRGATGSNNLDYQTESM